MKVLILGSGLLGVTAAYELGRRGHEVTVIDRQKESAAEGSFANGGQLSYSTGEPWATPSVLRKLPTWLADPSSPLVFRLRADWQMVRWGLLFLRNCTPARARANCENLLRIGLYSRSKMAEIRDQTGIEFDFGAKGILHIFSSEDDFDHAKRHNDFQATLGGGQRVLSRNECIELEPALAHSPRDIVGGIHSFMDETGDAYSYCNALAKIATERHKVRFLHGVSITGLRVEKSGIAAVATGEGDMTADAYVMALGSYSPIYLRKAGIDIPVYPMKGYSITTEANDFCPLASITDGTHKIVYTRLGKRLRVAGTAEFAGYDTSINEKRIAPIAATARAMFPKANWDGEIRKWACLRASTPDGPPILGKTRHRNLFLNTGHGTLGWTQAAGSAAIVADIIENKTPGIALQGLTVENRS